MGYKYIFTMIRDTESGELGLDAFFPLDLGKFNAWKAIKALVDSPGDFKLYHPTEYKEYMDAQQCIFGATMRASMAGSVLFGQALHVDSDELYTRDEFAQIVDGLPVDKLRTMILK